MRKYQTLSLILAIIIVNANAQKFMPDFGQQWGEVTYVVKEDGAKVWGRATSGMVGPNGLMSITLKDTLSGEKSKFKVKDIKEVGVSAKGTGKVTVALDAIGNHQSLKDAVDKDYESLLSADFYVYRRVVDKKGKPRILQLLNPSFETKMQVYHDPRSRKTDGAMLTGGLVGGESKSFYVTKEGSEEGIYVKKAKYEKTMKSLFGDCATLMSEFKPKFGDFSKHVFFYDSSCQQ